MLDGAQRIRCPCSVEVCGHCLWSRQVGLKRCLGVSHGVEFHSSATPRVPAGCWKNKKKGRCHQSNRPLLPKKEAQVGAGVGRKRGEEDGRPDTECLAIMTMNEL